MSIRGHVEASIKAVLAQLGINEHVPHALALPKQAGNVADGSA